MSLNLRPVGGVEVSNAGRPPVNLFTDAVMGEWTFDKKRSAGTAFWWVRKAEVTLAEAYAQDWTDPKTMKKSKVYGEIRLTERKSIDKKTSAMSMFKELEPKDGATVKEVVK